MESLARAAVEAHVRRFFHGHEVDVRPWPVGPIEGRIPGFRILCIGPGPQTGLWTYVTIGCWDAAHDETTGHGIELIWTSTQDDGRSGELLTMVAYYHAGPESQRLDVGHTVPIGEPWVPGSRLDHLLVSQPYPYGPDLENCRWEGGHARLLWLVPITKAERDFKAQEGLEALEERLEAGGGTEYWDPMRPSVV